MDYKKVSFVLKKKIGILLLHVVYIHQRTYKFFNSTKCEELNTGVHHAVFYAALNLEFMSWWPHLCKDLVLFQITVQVCVNFLCTNELLLKTDYSSFSVG